MLRFFWTYRKSTSGVIVVGKVQALETFLNFHETSSPLVWQCWLSKDWEEREKVLERANRRHTGQITRDWEGRKWWGSCTFLCAPLPREILKRNRYLASKKWSRELATYGDSCMVHLRRRLQMVNQDLKVQREGSPCRSPFPFGPASYRLLYSPSGQSLPLTEILLCL